MDRIKEYFAKEIINKETLSYMIWGGFTAFMTVVLYFVFVNTIFDTSAYGVVWSNTLANLIGIAAAYYTQKKYVFNTGDKSKEETRVEVIKFFASRIGTFILETILLYLLVEYLGFDKNISKIFTSFVTVILNYFVAKIAVFNSK